VGTETRRWRRSTFAGRFAAGHKGSLEKNAQGRSQPIQALSPAHGSVMERSPVAFDQNFSGLPDVAVAQAGAVSDFPELLRRKGLLASVVETERPADATEQVEPGYQKT